MLIVERDDELAAVQRLLASLGTGAGHPLLLEGAAGIGKSTVLAQAVDRARERGITVLRASASEFEQPLAHGVLRQLVEPVIRARGGVPEGAAAPVGWILDDSAQEHDDPTFALLNGVYWFVSALADEGPLMIAVDDLHWTDLPSLRALDHVLRRIDDLPVGLVLTTRPAEPGAPNAVLDELRHRPGVEVLTPRPLSVAGVRDVVRERLPAASDAGCEACHAETAGNPLLVHELVRALAADGADVEGADAVQRVALPTMAERVLRRVDTLGDDAAAITRAAAILGDGATHVQVAGLGQTTEERAETVLRALTGIDVLAGNDPCRFSHPLVRRSLLDDIPSAERDRLHARAADVLRDDALAAAVHLTVLRPAGNERVAQGLRDAADLAMARAAPDAAIALLRRAVAEYGDGPVPNALLIELGRAEVATRDPACVVTLRRAYDREADVRRRADVGFLLAEVLSHAGLWDAMDAVLGELHTLPEDEHDRAADIQMLRFAMMIHDPRFTATLDAETARLLPLTVGDGSSPRALAAVMSSSATFRGDVAQARELAGRALDDGVLLGDRSMSPWAAVTASLGTVLLDDVALSRRLAGTLAARGRESGSLIASGTARLIETALLARSGMVGPAAVDVRALMDMIAGTGMAMWTINVLHLCVDVLVEREDVDDCATAVQALEIGPAFSDSTTGGQLAELRGRLGLLRGDRAAAIDDLRTAVAVDRGLRIAPTASVARSELALALGPDERDEALGLAREELEMAQRTGLARGEGIALRAVGQLTGGPAGLDLLEQAVRCTASDDLALEHARSLTAYGAALRRAGRVPAARDALAQALDIAHRGGAQRLERRATEELLAAGARPRRPARHGVGALTPTQDRVVRLAAAGASNPEIAQELWVSVKTVETHLSGAYAKLGIGGQGARASLAEVLREAP
ncbi:MAG: AAA family ATPase [Solirubrobacteraceae bacterium]|nr:AAA family ATPase [Solirubrobacteraceae bacterium]